MIYMFVDDIWVQASADERHDSVLVLHCVTHVTAIFRQYNKSYKALTKKKKKKKKITESQFHIETIQA